MNSRDYAKHGLPKYDPLRGRDQRNVAHEESPFGTEALEPSGRLSMILAAVAAVAQTTWCCLPFPRRWFLLWGVWFGGGC